MEIAHQYVVSVRELTKDYPSFHFGPATLDLVPGYVYGIVGPNGAGKTTLLRMLMGLVQPTTGLIKIFGLDHRSHEKTIKQQIGFVPEQPSLYREMNAQWFGQFSRVHYPTWSDELYNELLQRFGVDPTAASKTLSKGTRMKLNLALALAHSPRLLILDEPTSGLDPLVRKEVLNQISAVVQDEDRTVILSTHITEDIERIADYIIFVIDGHIALMEQCEVLRDQWHELLIPAKAAAKIPGVTSVTDVGNGIVRVAVRSATSITDSLQQEDIEPLHQRPLALDEILSELVGSDDRL